MACSPLSSSMSSVLVPPCARPIFFAQERIQLLSFPTQSRFALMSNKPFLRGSSCVARFGFKPGLLPDPDMSDNLMDFKHLLERAEGIMYTIADGISTSDAVTSAASTTTDQQSDWLSGITNTLESVLKVLKNGLTALHIPYSYGFAIILLTILVKAATFPLTKKQVESAMAVRAFQPQIKAIQQRYAGDQEKIQLETARLYKLAGVNPFAGCLPTLATIPVWIGLYRALSNVANEGLLTEGFFWIPSLAGPTTIGDRQNGTGVSWLFPFIDGHPPLGWPNTLAYLVLPVLLVISQYISVQVMQSAQGNDPSVKNAQAITRFLPLMIGYFALSVPSGLSLYWFTNNILSTAQQYWLQKSNAPKGSSKQVNTDFLNDAIFQQPNSNDIDVSIEEPSSESLSPPGERFKQLKALEARKTEDPPSSTKPQPGDRFRQLKEEEARRRQQREEENATSLNGHNQTGLSEEENSPQNGHLNQKTEKQESLEETRTVEKQV